MSKILKLLTNKTIVLAIENSDIKEISKVKIHYINPIHISTQKILRKKILFFLIFLNLLSRSSQNSILIKIAKSGNNIPICYDGSSTQCDVASPVPIKVLINNVQKSTAKCKYDFPTSNNLVQLTFSTSITSTSCMFHGCTAITEVDLSSFDTSKIIKMYSMFRSCTALTSIILSNVVTTKVTDMHRMFDGCNSLTYLDLSEFRSSNSLQVYNMFEGCSKLKSLDISNLDSTKFEFVENVFKGCSSLEYINLENTKISSEFLNLITALNSNGLIICSKDSSLSSKSTLSQIINCNNNNKCFKKSSASISSGKLNCNKCGDYFYKKYSDSSNTGSFINCYYNPQGFYLEGSYYKPYYSTCKTCSKGGIESTHNCDVCSTSYSRYKFLVGGKYNCHNTCPNYTYKVNGNTQCTESLNCPINYPKLIYNKNECIDDCSKDTDYKYENNGICTNINPNVYTTELIKKVYTTEIIKEEYTTQLIKKEYTAELIIESNTPGRKFPLEKTEINIRDNTNFIDINNNYNINSNKNLSFGEIIQYILHNHNKTDILKGNDLEIEFNGILISLSTTYNQKNYLDINKTSI